MTATVHREPLDDFITSVASQGSETPLGASPSGVCVLRSEAVSENLKRRLAVDGIPIAETTSFETIESLARGLLKAHHGREPSIIGNRVLNRVIEGILTNAVESDSDGPIAAFVEGLSLTEDMIEDIQLELEDYFICTDSGRSHEEAASLLEDVEDEFGHHRSKITLEGFEALHEKLQTRMEEFPNWFYLTRSHLVTAAREHADAWDEVYPERSWLAMGTINVLDNPTLRLFAALDEIDDGPNLEFCFGAGSESRLIDRLRRAGVSVETQGQRSMSASGANRLFETATGRSIATELEDNVSLLEAPDRRREVVDLAESVRDLIAEGVSSDEILIVSENLDDYRSIIADIFHTHEIPFDIETRTPMAHTVAYRFCKSTLELINPEDSDTSYTDLIDPLRLGFCHPDESVSGTWPLDDRQFLRIEQRLSSIQADQGEMSLPEWKAKVDQLKKDGAVSSDWEDVSSFLSWVEDIRADPPTEGGDVNALLNTLLETHLYETAADPVRSSPGPGVDTSRNDTNTAHQTYAGTDLLQRTGAVARYFDMATQMLDSTAGWPLANRSLSDAVGSRDIGYPHADANGVRFVEAENAYYRDAKNVFILGVSAGEFPADRDNKTFLHDAFRKTVEKSAAEADPETPETHLYLPTKEIQYEQGINRYETALSTVTDCVHVSMHYLNSENDPVSWSPFVDLLPHDPDEDPWVTRLPVGAWLPSKQDTEQGWGDVWNRVPERDRLRAYTFYTTVSGSGPAPVLDRADIQELAIRIQADALDTEIKPKRERYLNPPMEIQVNADEPGFDTGPSLKELAGPPFRPHEVDVFSQCQLRYYFYQHYFVNDGDEPDRAVEPNPMKFSGDHRNQTLPHVIRRHQTTQGFRDRLENLITDLLPNRRALVDQFSTMGDLMDWARKNDLDANVSHDRGLIQNLVLERQLVEAEIESDSSSVRDWEWTGDAEYSIRGTKIRLPGHRRDRIETGDVSVYYTGEDDAARQALKACWNGTGGPRSFRCEDVCESCDEFEDCQYSSKQLYDHRIHLAFATPQDTDGVIFQDRGQSTPDSRYGIVNDEFDSNLVSASNLQTGLERVAASSWSNIETTMISELSHHLSEMKPESNTTYEVDQSYVDAGGCEGCAYRELCQVPHQEGGTQ
jgi:ATP-dependent helicase/nuclease subunit B